MVKIFKTITLITCLFLAAKTHAQLFPAGHVCMPKTEKLGSKLNFQVRTHGQCTTEEQWMQVHQQQGVWMLVPSDPPLSPEQKSDLDKAKSFWGGN